MLKYIQQFVQTVLREASKSRPKSRKARSSVDVTNGKSSMRPEILSINYEGQEAERSKEILELKRTYSILMKKFVNPKLDLMTGIKIENDTNIFSLRAKQELIKYVINKIFYEKLGQQQKLKSMSRDFSTENVKPIIEEELTFGWSGQRTSKLAANPMVEKPSYSKKIATGYLHQSSKNQSNGASSGLQVHETKKENILVSGTINKNQNDESIKKGMAETKKEKICSDEIGDNHSPSKEIYKENLQPSLNLELNSLSDTNENLSHRKEDVKQYNQKKNLNMIRSITKVDQSKTAKSNNHPLKEKNKNETTKVKIANTDQNKAIRNQNTSNIPQKNVKTSVDNQKKVIELLKKNKTQNDKIIAGKKEKSSSSNKILDEPLPDPLPYDPPSAIEETSKFTNVTTNEPSEKVELSDTRKEIRKENKTETGETLSRKNQELFEKEQDHTSCSNGKNTVHDLKEPPYSDGLNQAKTSIEKSTDEPINENPESIGKTYWNYISNKLLQTSNDAQQFINSLEISNWKTKNVSTADRVNKISDKPIGIKLADESSEQDNQNIPNSSEFNAISSIKSKVKGVADVEGQKYQNVDLKAPMSKREEQHFSKKKLFKEINSLEPRVKRSRTKISKSKCTLKETDSSSKKSSTNLKYYNEAHASKTKSTASFNLRNHEKHSSELNSKENNINSDENMVPEGDGKIKTLLRRFKKIQKSKSKRNIGNVERTYNKLLNDGNIKRAPFYKFKVNKDKSFIRKTRKVIRTKSDMLATNETLSPNIPGETMSNMNSLCINKTKIKMNKTNIPVSYTKATHKSAVKLNRVDSNVFPSGSSIKHEYVKAADQSTLTNLVEQSISKRIEQSTMYDNSRQIKTGFDLTKPRKLHCKKEIYKETNLKMYGAKRSIYTNSNRKTTPSKSMLNEVECKNIGEPHFSNMASSSLITVSKITPKLYRKSTSLITTQVKHLHTTRFTSYHRAKGRQLPKRKSTIIKEKETKKTEPADADRTSKISRNEERTVNISKSEEIKSTSEHCLSTNKFINEVCTSFSPKSEVINQNSLKAVDSKYVCRNKRTDNNIICSAKDPGDPLLSSSSKDIKINDNNKVNRPDKNESLPAIYSLKKETLADTTSNATPLCPDITLKSTESDFNLEGQNDPPSEGKETLIDSPKWKSRDDRLEKWKLEVASNNTTDTDIKTNVHPENHSNEVQIESIKINDKIVASGKEFVKSDSSIDHEYKSIMHLLKVKPGEMIEQKVMRDTTTYDDFGNKIIKVEHEDKRLQKEPNKALEQIVKKEATNYNDFGNKIIKAELEDKKSLKDSDKPNEQKEKRDTSSFDDSGNKIIKVEQVDKKSVKSIKEPGKSFEQKLKKDTRIYNDSGNKIIKPEHEDKKTLQNLGKSHEQKVKKDTTSSNHSGKNIKTQHEDKKSQKNPGIHVKQNVKWDTTSYNNSGNKIIKVEHESKKSLNGPGIPPEQKVKRDTTPYNDSVNKIIKPEHEDKKSLKYSGKTQEQKVKRDTTIYNYSRKNIINAEHEDKKSQKYSGSSLSTTNHSTKKKSQNSNVTPIKIESNNEVTSIKACAPQKLKEFESKLQRLESKLKALELKSLNRPNYSPLPRTQSQNNIGLVTSSAEGNRLPINENKTGDKAMKLNKEYISSKNNINNKNSQSVRLDSASQSKNKLTLSEKYYNKSDKKDQNDPMKEHLSKKVKNLELKLKSLESTIQDLKVKPKCTVSNKELHKIYSLNSRTSEDNIKTKFEMNTGKLNENKDSLNNESNVKQSNWYNEQQNHIKIQNKESYGTKTVDQTKPEVSSKNSLDEKKTSAMSKNILNNRSNNVSISLPPQILSGIKELNLKGNNVKTLKKSSEEILKQDLLNKGVKMSKLNEAKKNVSHIKSKADIQKTRGIPIKSNVTSIKGTHDNTSLINNMINESNANINQKKSARKFCPVSVISRTSNNANVSSPPRIPSDKKELNVKDNNVKTLTISEEILMQKLLLKSVKMSRLKGATKNMSEVENKADVQKTDFWTPIKGNYDKKTYFKQINSMINGSNTNTNQNESGQNTHPDSTVSSTSNINLTVPKKRELSKSLADDSVQLKKVGKSKISGLGSKVYKVKRKNKIIEDAKIKNTTIPKNSLKKFSTEKKSSLKRNPKVHSVKKGYAHSDHRIDVVEKQNTLNKSIVKSSKDLELVGSDSRDTMKNITGKVGFNPHIKHSICDQNLECPVLPERILKTLSNLTTIPKKQEDSKSTNSETERLEMKINVHSTDRTDNETKIKTNQKLKKSYNSFDYYRPKRRTHEIKHPIEKEKYDLKFHSPDDSIHEKLYLSHLIQNSTLHSESPVESEKREILSGEFHNKGDKKWDSLITFNNSIAVKRGSNEVDL